MGILDNDNGVFGKNHFDFQDLFWTVKDNETLNTYSKKQSDLYYFETIKMTSQAWSNFVWRIRAAGEYSL